jgi:GTPase Era involved in 16S rRNA processing
MKKVFIKYNPYKLETEITVEGKKLKTDSKLLEKSADCPRLQEWVEELPQILVDEFNTTDFEIEFHGTLLDYEDLTSVITDAQNRGKITAKCKHKPALETSEKERLIDRVFTKIQHGPFEELKDDQITNAFNNAKSSDFEVCVVATMSAGKSTLINAMIGTKLMPSKQAACTAMIARIKDIKGENEFKLKVYDVNNKDLEAPGIATLDTLCIYNDCPIKYKCTNSTPKCPEAPLKPDDCPYMDKKIPYVGSVCLSGNIPFTESNDVSLVLIDTPGPNAARDKRHKEVQSQFLEKSSKALVLYIMTGEFGTDDDNTLLKRVADSMTVGGKKSKDRFIFVVNKLDDRKKEDGELEDTLKKVEDYLANHKIKNPNIFPAAARPALYIRLKKNLGNTADAEVSKLAQRAIEDFADSDGEVDLHFDKHSSLPKRIQNEIDSELEAAKQNKEQIALIHTGVVSIEKAIRQYVQKYAKTAKIKNIVDTFIPKLDESGYFEKTKQELAKHQKEGAKIVKQIASIQEKIDSAKEAEKFKDAVKVAVAKVNDESKEVVDGIIQEFQDSITKKIDDFREKEIDIDEVEQEVGELEEFAKKLGADLELELDDLIRTNLVNTSKVLLEGYKNKLASLTKEIDVKGLADLTIDPLKLMGGSFDFSAKELEKEKEVEDGKVEEQTRGWFESIFFWPKKEWVTKYKKVKYIKGSELAREFLRPVEKNLSDNGDAACIYALKQSKRISYDFNEKFKQLDDILKSKLDELNSYATDQKKAEKRIKESKRNLKWLEQIKEEVESILEI